MSWFKFLPNIFGGARDVAEVFVENREKKGQRTHESTMAGIGHDMEVLKQFAAEFHQRQQRSWWDSLIDGLNRLPRPLLTFSIIGFFVLTPLYPEKFIQIAKAYELMPAGYWALLSIIIGFYFGGRMQIKSQDMKVKTDAVQAARDLVVMKEQFRNFDLGLAIDQVAEPNSAKKPTQNKVVDEWKKSQNKGDSTTEDIWGDDDDD